MEPTQGPTRGPPLNCSAQCGDRSCSIHPGVHSQEAWEILYQLCSLASQSGVEVERKPLSPVLCAVVWTLLSCGILLALLFLLFTLRFRNNRIVKMSSPNLNILTLCGSVLTYSSGFLFAIEERSLLPETGPRTAMQARIWTLCIGSSLVFGPILGKTWRIYRVFTQRVPDKRVIIRDTQLMGLVALVILLDILVLAAWGWTDPVQCAKSINAVVKVVERDVSYSLSQLDSCSSLHSDVWIILFSVLKGSLLLYGTYLAGLTSNVSSPPVNQSPTIVTAACLVTVSVAVTVPVSKLLHNWPNMVYSVVSGAIFICTLAIDCLLFVPQLTQWKRFEDELNPDPGQMAKYFSSPSKSLRSMYSEDEIYYLLGENSSMKRLLTEKNAMIDSLQEQVNSAKDKLLRLMVVSGSPEQDGDMDSSNTNLNSSSTQVTELPPDIPGLLLETEDDPPRSSPPRPPPTPPLPPHVMEEVTRSAGSRGELSLESLRCNSEELQAQLRTTAGPSGPDAVAQGPPEVATPPSNDIISGSAPQSPPAISPDGAGSPGAPGALGTLAVLAGGKPGFVSSEQLQEILQDLCVDAVSASLRSPGQARRPPNPARDEPLPRSSGSPVSYLYPSISPYVMRKRRPPFHASRARPPSYCYPGSAPLTRRGVAPHGVDPETEPLAAVTPPPPADAGKVSTPEEEGAERHAENVPLRWARRGSRWDERGPPRRCTTSAFPRSHPKPGETEGPPGKRGPGHTDPYDYSDSDSSSSEDSYCFYHRPYCNVCLQGPYCNVCLQGPYESTESTVSEASDSEWGHKSHPVVNFNEDLKPTFV